MENEILKEAVEIAAAKKWIARALIARGRPMKSVCLVLGVTRSNLYVRQHRCDDWQDGRRDCTPAQDEALMADLGRHIADLPSYGYRRAGVLLNRERCSQGQATLNHKRIYRVMGRFIPGLFSGSLGR